jgi:predicted metal-dependent HD superfamily phosphohydrolase
MPMRAAGAALHDLLATAALSSAARNTVLRQMATSRRHYHGLLHLATLWTRHCRFGIGTPFLAPAASRLIACAIAFHDAVYDATRRDNEHRSALLWRRYAPRDLSPADVDWVAATIEATSDHLASRDASTQRARLRLWLLDLDLTPLGEEPELFARNTRRLRAEYRHLREADWEGGRLAFLRKLQTAPALFRSAPLAAAFEAQARWNIARELGKEGTLPRHRGVREGIR